MTLGRKSYINTYSYCITYIWHDSYDVRVSTRRQLLECKARPVLCIKAAFTLTVNQTGTQHLNVSTLNNVCFTYNVV